MVCSLSNAHHETKYIHLVLNGCQQYLTHNSNLTKRLEAIAALGNDCPTSVILSTTDPTIISTPLLNSMDYVILQSMRSLLWNAFLRNHFAIDFSNAQLRSGRAIIWSPESTSVLYETAGEVSQQHWNDDLTFIEINQLKQTMPAILPESNFTGIGFGETIPNGAEGLESEIQATGQEKILAAIPGSYEDGKGSRGYQEDGVISLDKLGLDSLRSSTSDAHSLSKAWFNIFHRVCDAEPRIKTPFIPILTESASTTTSSPTRTHQKDPAAKFAPLISVISTLGDGKPGTLVDYKTARKEMKSRKQEIKRLGWASAKLGPIARAARQERVIKSIVVDIS